jgi:hypothetical protein
MNYGAPHHQPSQGYQVFVLVLLLFVDLEPGKPDDAAKKGLRARVPHFALETHADWV